MLLYELKKWIVELLDNQDSIFERWDQSDLTLSEIWDNFKFKSNGVIKAWYDGCELTYDGLKKKNVVRLSFTNFVTFEYLDGTSDWSYTSLPWCLKGYSSKIESKIATIAQQGLRYFKNVSDKKINKFYSWIVGNVFSIYGII